jgi:ribosomal protein L3 glutamine methyltransferase
MAAIDELHSVRDLVRYATSRFTAARLVFGHGTDTAFDEAVFMVLEGLNLPIDQLEPFLDARTTLAERGHVLSLIEARVETRKPAAYLLGRAYLQGVPFRVDERVIVPRSFIAELLAGDMVGPGGLVEDPDEIGSILELCTGSGCLSILAAMRFQNAFVDAVDLSRDALEVAAMNVTDHHLDARITLHAGDLYQPVKGRRFDLIIANPPYVRAGAVSAFTPEYATEPIMAHLGGADGLDIVRRILSEAAEYLHPSGGLLCEVGQERAALEEAFPATPFLWLDTENSHGEVFWLPSGEFPN